MAGAAAASPSSAPEEPPGRGSGGAGDSAECQLAADAGRRSAADGGEAGGEARSDMHSGGPVGLDDLPLDLLECVLACVGDLTTVRGVCSLWRDWADARVTSAGPHAHDPTAARNEAALACLGAYRGAERIRSLSISGGQGIPATAYAHLSALKSLSDLSVARCGLTAREVAALCDALRACSAPVTRLDFSGNYGLGKDAVQALCQWLSARKRGDPALLELCLDQCFDVDDTCITQLASAAPKLQVLSLQDCPAVSDDGLWGLEGMTSLRELDLRSLKLVSDEGLRPLSRLAGLTKLCLRACDGGGETTDYNRLFGVTSDGMRFLGNLTNLQSLDLSLGRVSDVGIAKLAPLTGLTCLHVRRCPRLTDRAVTAIAANFPRLRDLDVAWNESLTDDGTTALSALTELTRLSLEGRGVSGRVSRISDKTLLAIAAIPGLRELDVSRCDIGDAGVSGLLAGGAPLSHLDLSHCPRVSAASCAALASVGSLRELWLNDCHVGNAGLMALAGGAGGRVRLRGLRRLSLQGAAGVDGQGVGHLAGLPALEELHLDGCGIDARSVDELRRALPSIFVTL
ncbi:unnamed protein product [Pedinophyceae sp. YPF-701]|nr:unnamed protein product [Pedinophyceae sp. YPF-701]